MYFKLLRKNDKLKKLTAFLEDYVFLAYALKMLH